MDVSIIIVSWNTRDLLRACLRSIFDHLGALRAEVIVVDNASGDGSPDMVAEQFPQVQLIRNQRNIGFAPANNQAMRASRGRYILLLNSDTEVLAGVLEAMVTYGDAHRDVGVLGCRVLNPDRTLQPTCFRFPTLGYLVFLASGLHRLRWPRWAGRYHMRGWLRDDVRDVEVVTGCCMLVRRTALDEVGLFDERFFLFGEETDWCVRFRRGGWAVRFAPVGEIVHHGGASATQIQARRGLLLWGGLVRLHRKHGGRVAAAVAWGLLWLFNVSRWVFWAFTSLLSRRPDHRALAGTYRYVTVQFAQAWPGADRDHGGPEVA